jgi:hypothetical protein
MHSLSASDLLDIWERAAAQPPARRSLLLLNGAGNDPRATAAMSIGERDRALMLLRRQLFGDQIEGLTECRGCRSRVEVRFEVSQVAESDTAAAMTAPLTAHGYEVHWRLPTCGDLAELSGETSPQRLRQRMLERCLLAIRREQQLVNVADCPPALINDVCMAMANADPLADVRLDVTCPECGIAWKSSFDIGAFLWREIDAWARRLLSDIYRLASAYGWSERDILAMSPRRRGMYLDLVRA